MSSYIEPVAVYVEPVAVYVEPTAEPDYNTIFKPQSDELSAQATTIKINYTMEYDELIKYNVIKSTIISMLYILVDMEDSDDKSYDYSILNVLTNFIILHRSIINSSELKTDIKAIGNKIKSDFIKSRIFKLLNPNNNTIHFCELNLHLNNKPPLNAEDIIIIEKTLPQISKKIRFKKEYKIFKPDEIVGAKDKENNWWLSRILHVFSPPDNNNTWYYVRFEGWGPEYDEWINSKTFKVRPFNPKKHILKRVS